MSFYYMPSGYPVFGSQSNSNNDKAELTLIRAGFDKLPTPTGFPNALVKVKGDESGLDLSVVTLTSAGVVAGITGLTGTGNFVLTGATMTVATQALGDSSTKAASTAFAMTMQSPAFSGVPTAPTAAPGTSNTQIATTAFAAALAFSAALPGQVSVINGHLRSKGTGTAAWHEDSFTTLTVGGTLLAWNPYRFNTATQTYLLPASPTDGDECLLANIGTNVDNILSGNGHNIVGPYASGATFTMDIAYAIYRVKYDATSTVWRAF